MVTNLTALKNRNRGAAFEKLFEYRARACGVTVIKQPLAIRYLRGGKMQPIKADLDFVLLGGEGKVAWVDTKVVNGDYFLRSRMPQAQIDRAMLYETHGIRAGFVVHFEPLKLVAFFGGTFVASMPARTRAGLKDAVVLGSWDRFCFDALWATRSSQRSC
jgi:hypothetical protein